MIEASKARGNYYPMETAPLRREDINLEPEWRDALVYGNEHTTVDTGLVTVMIFGMTPEDAKKLEEKLLEGIEL